MKTREEIEIIINEYEAKYEKEADQEMKEKINSLLALAYTTLEAIQKAS